MRRSILTAATADLNGKSLYQLLAKLIKGFSISKRPRLMFAGIRNL